MYATKNLPGIRGRFFVTEAVIPIPNQSGIFVGSSFCSSTCYQYAFVASILAALMSSLI
jgi:hypothetical protein